MTAAELAEKIGGIVEGDGSVEITGLAGLSEAEAGDLSFLSNPKYASEVEATSASAVVVNDSWSGPCSCALIKVSQPDAAFTKAAALLGPSDVTYEKGIHPTAVVSDEAKIGTDASIGPCCVIEKGVVIGDRAVITAGVYIGENVVVGDDCVIYQNAVICHHTVMGSRVMIHNGAVIGSDGFGNYMENGKWKKIPQLGIVEIRDDVEIGANTTVDRARFGKTLIEEGARIDNLVMIAHNCRIGRNTAMAAQVGMSGSTVIGNNVLLGGQSGFAGHLKVGDGAIVGAQGGVTKDVEPGSYVTGYPAMPHKKAAKLHAHTMRIPALKQKLKELEQRVAELEQDGVS